MTEQLLYEAYYGVGEYERTQIQWYNLKEDNMPLKAPVGGQSFPPLEEGQYHAICYAVFDLGHQTVTIKGIEKSLHKVVIIFELPDERLQIDKEDGTHNLPRAISKTYTLSMHENAWLRKDIESWRGKRLTALEAADFDILKLLSKNCLIQVLNNEKDGRTYSNIETIIKLPKGMKEKPVENPVVSFSFEDDDTLPETTPEWIKNIIMESDEWTLKYASEAPQAESYKQETSNDVPPEHEVLANEAKDKDETEDEEGW